jgi:hypothetical protein
MASPVAHTALAGARSPGTRSPGALLTHVPRRPTTQPSGVSLAPSTKKPYWACPEQICTAIVQPVTRVSSHRYALPEGGPLLEGGGELGGYDPQDLQSAYKIPTTGGSTQTVAIVDAFGDATAESDLAKYRERYGLPACTKASGCFHKVNESGEEAHYPEANKGWEGETSLDLDMVSAACPQCHILLVQATTASVLNLAESENRAVSLGATEVTNSYGIAEGACGSGHCEEFNSYYHHAGVLIVASSGDSGYNNFYEKQSSPSFPATSQYVLAVGGTSLHKATGTRGWSEAVWNEPSRELGTGSGCSLSQAKPSWQKDKGCTKRTDNDVAAVAACETPLSVYSTAYKGWEDFCGTSASAPLMTGILAHTNEHTRALGPQAFYEDPATLYPVTKGSNGTCSVEYLCNAEKSEAGYEGPAGLGTPHGLPGQPPTVSGVLPAVGLPLGGVPVKISGTNLLGTTSVKFGGASALNFTVESETSIAAVAPPGQGTVDVTVTTPGGASAANAADQFSYFIPALFEWEGVGYRVHVEEGKELSLSIPSGGATFSFGPLAVDGAAGETGKLEIDTKPAFESSGLGGYLATGHGIVSSVAGYAPGYGRLFGPLNVVCTPPATVVLGDVPIVASAGEATKQYSASFEAECVLAPGELNERITAHVTMKARGPERVSPGQAAQLTEAGFTVTLPTSWREDLLGIGASEVSGKSASDATAIFVP